MYTMAKAAEVLFPCHAWTATRRNRHVPGESYSRDDEGKPSPRMGDTWDSVKTELAAGCHTPPKLGTTGIPVRGDLFNMKGTWDSHIPGRSQPLGRNRGMKSEKASKRPGEHGWVRTRGLSPVEHRTQPPEGGENPPGRALPNSQPVLQSLRKKSMMHGRKHAYYKVLYFSC